MKIKNKSIKHKIEELEHIIYELSETQKMTEEEIIENLDNVIIQMSKKNSNFPKKMNDEIPIEDYLETMLCDQFKKINKGDSIEKKVDDFIKYIGFTNNEIVKKAFISVYEMDRKRISYSTILDYMSNYLPNVKKNIIESELREAYKKWEAKNPEIKEKYQMASIIPLLKVFKKNAQKNRKRVR